MLQSGNDGEENIKQGELSFLPERTCAICYQDQNSLASEAEIIVASAASGGVIGSAQTDITNPYETVSCGCIYCFVCIASRLEAEEGEGWVCLRCGEIVKECKPWNGDVLEEVAKHTSNRRSVGFPDDPEKGGKEGPVVIVDPPLELDVLGEDELRDISDEQSEAYEEDEAPEFDDN